MSSRQENALRWLFPVAFTCACLLFWWSPSILMALLKVTSDLKPWTLEVSAAALCVFLVGYLFSLRLVTRPLLSARVNTLCSDFAFKATVALALPAMVVGAQFAIYRAGLAYGEGHDIPIYTQAILYTHMFFAYMFLGSVPSCEGSDRRKVLWATVLVLVPRILITLHWGRFFAGQTVVAILFIALARGWIRMTARRWIQLFVVALLIFLGPILTRGGLLETEKIAESAPQIVAFFEQGSTLHFFQEYHDDLPSTCPPILVSMTERVIPYDKLGVCTIKVGDRTVPETVDNLLTRQDSNNLGTGTGSIYIFELYLVGGVFAIILGSLLFGACCRWWVEHLGSASLFGGIWAECLVRSLMAPRGTLGYEFQRIPTLLLATLAVILLCQAIDILGMRVPVFSPDR
ncbi:MAG TPA: O-antigen polymerase [Acidobacteriaceae bacterium]|nr:O-antigen polymerase [Acidobacteriaceae bacterium]